MVQQSLPNSSLPQRGPEGFVLTVSQTQRYAGLLIFVIGLIWTAFSAVMLIVFIGEPFGFFSLFPAVFISLFVLVGVLMAGAGLLELWSNLKLHPAELILPKYPLRLGETCSIHYRRRLRRGTFSKPGRVEAQLVCDEWVEYTQGTDKVTKTHSLHEAELPTRTVVTGEQQADYESRIAISSKELPSFLAKHNQIRWRVIVKLTVPGIPQKCQSEFSLQVLPEVLA